MPDRRPGYDDPEALLVGADRPRPLSGELRTRLEEALEGARGGRGGEPGAARALPSDVRRRLETSFRPSARAKRVRAIAAGVSVAAAIAAVLGVLVPGSAPNGQALRADAHSRSAALLAREPARGQAATAEPAGAPATGAPATGAPAAHAPAASARAAVGVARPSGFGTVRAAPTKTEPRKGAVSTKRAGLAPLDVGGLGSARKASERLVPTVLRLSPRSGPTSGGNWVVVRGRDLAEARGVDFGNARCVGLRILSATRLEARAPTHLQGTVNVVVLGPSAKSQVVPADRYSFDR